MGPEMQYDEYDRLASWAHSNYGSWSIYERTKHKGFLGHKQKISRTSYETIPADIVSMWIKTGRKIIFHNGTDIILNGDILSLPNLYSRPENNILLRQIVAYELAYPCMGIKSPTDKNTELPKAKNCNDIKKEYHDSSGGLLAKADLFISLLARGIENERIESENKALVDKAWKVANALLMPINALCVFDKTGLVSLTKSKPQDFQRVFGVTQDMANVFYNRTMDKIRK